MNANRLYWINKNLPNDYPNLFLCSIIDQIKIKIHLMALEMTEKILNYIWLQIHRGKIFVGHFSLILKYLYSSPYAGIK